MIAINLFCIFWYDSNVYTCDMQKKKSWKILQITLELEFKSGHLYQLITLLSIGSFQENFQEKSHEAWEDRTICWPKTAFWSLIFILLSCVLNHVATISCMIFYAIDRADLTPRVALPNPSSYCDQPSLTFCINGVLNKVVFTTSNTPEETR